MSKGVKKSNQLSLEIASLGFNLDAQDSDLKIVLPHSYEKFIKPVAQPQAFLLSGQREKNIFIQHDLLILEINNDLVVNDPHFLKILPIFQSEIWAIKFDSHDSFILEALRLPPARRIIINKGFSRGEVQGDFSESNIEGFHPLQDLDMKLFVNWLARFGDIIMHASGVSVDGKGYAFAGVAGAGKSTLAASLLNNHSVTVLGEDQVILRYLDGRFWIFGTPWHENPAMCSPVGVPLEKLFFLNRDAQQGLKAIKPVDGVSSILQTAFIPFYRQDLLPGILERLEHLSNQVPFFSLNYPLGMDPWPLIIKA
ncbi:MAG: hypothetical protein SCH68_12685 [Brevefilum sp.]|nr:hypothetical protein [Brevefilum sp.]